MQAIDLFSGAGGMSIGAEMAGISVKYAVELDTYAAQTFASNHKNTKLFNQDIRQIKLTDFDTLNQNQPKIIFGGPPCQGFSTSAMDISGNGCLLFISNSRSRPDPF